MHPGKLEIYKAALPEFAVKTRGESQNLFYEFTINGDEVFCREGYVNAEALLAHVENVGMLAEAFKVADLIRIEIHGPAAAKRDVLKGHPRSDESRPLSDASPARTFTPAHLRDRTRSGCTITSRKAKVETRELSVRSAIVRLLHCHETTRANLSEPDWRLLRVRHPRPVARATSS